MIKFMTNRNDIINCHKKECLKLRNLLKLLRWDAASVTLSSSSTMSFLRAALQSSLRSSRVLAIPRISYSLRSQAIVLQRATFASQPTLTKEDIQSRVIDVLKGFEKVDAAKVRLKHNSL